MQPSSFLEKSIQVGKIIILFNALEQYPFNTFLSFYDRILGSKCLHRFDVFVGMQYTEDGIIFFDRQFFGNGRLISLVMLNPDISPKTKHFLTDRILKTVGKGNRDNHRSDAYNGSGN